MMYERVVILPTKDNAGKSLYRPLRTIKSAILRVCGGFSEVRQVGQWSENGKTYKDASLRLYITVTPAQDEWLCKVLPIWCDWLSQVCIYTHRTEVEMAYVYPPVPQEVSA